MANMTFEKVIPAIMIGGSGTRLWPLSRANMPKQFLRLTNELSLFQNTLERTRDAMFADPWLLTGNAFMDLVHQQTSEIDAGFEAIILEPQQRGTAAALAAIATSIGAVDPEALILAMPADHAIKNPDGFRAAVRQAIPIAKASNIVTFGIVPTAPETGFGYIRPGRAILHGDIEIGAAVEQPGGFLEKPNLARAREFVDAGYYWNAGIFLFKASVMLAELELHAPETLAAVERAMLNGTKTAARPFYFRPNEDDFTLSPADVPIDTAVMEKCTRVAVVPCDNIGWTDIGSLSALWELHDKDPQGNVVRGTGLVAHANDCFVYSTTDRRVVLSHTSNLMVIDTEDAVVVLPREEAQRVKDIVAALKKIDAPEVTFSRSAVMDWGTIRIETASDTNRVCAISVMDGSEFSHMVVAGGSEIWVLNSGHASYETDGVRKAFIPGVPVMFPRGEHIEIAASGDRADFTFILHAPTDDLPVGAWFTPMPNPAFGAGAVLVA